MTLSSVRIRHRIANNKPMRFVALLAAPVLCTVLLSSTPAVASASTNTRTHEALPGNLSEFAHCPVDNPNVSLCLAASDTATFTINSTTLTETSPITLSLGLIANPDGSYTAVLPDDGTPALSAPPIPVPGGLLNIPGSSGLLAVTATPQLVGTPVFNLDNLLSGDGPAITLPSDVLLTNPLLGADCTVGTPNDPEVLNLTDGTTNPPPPNMPITGSLGKLRVLYNGKAVKTKGTRLVDNSYGVPGASGCGPGGFFDPLLDYLRGLPSAAGTNSAILSGTSGLAEAKLIRKYIG